LAQDAISIMSSLASAEFSVRLPVAGLRFAREITLRRGEPVAYFRETVTNERRGDRFFHWVEHVTLGSPFLTHEHSRIFLSGSRGRTFPHGYAGKALLESSRDFRWPFAPAAEWWTCRALSFARDWALSPLYCSIRVVKSSSWPL